MTTVRRIELHSIPVSARTTWLVVSIADGDGRVGLGECSDAAPGAVTAGLVRRIEALLRGHDTDAARELLPALAEHLVAAGAGAFAARTVCGGVATALGDLAAQRAGVPLWSWLAPGRPAPDSIELYANLNRSLGRRRPEDFARQARHAVADGFRAVKVAPFDGLTGPRRAAEGLVRARAVRDAVGPGVDLMIDVHDILEPPELRAIGGGLARLGPRWVEDAARIDDLDALRAAREAVGAPLAGGEFAVAVREVHPALEAGLLDVLVPDLKHAGGPRPALELACAATRAGAQVSLHNPSGPVATAASLHASVAAGAGLLEFAYGEVPWRGAVVDPPEEPENGRLAVPATPGLGVSLSHLHAARGAALAS
jgi:galactonate dehydratase